MDPLTAAIIRCLTASRALITREAAARPRGAAPLTGDAPLPRAAVWAIGALWSLGAGPPRRAGLIDTCGGGGGRLGGVPGAVRLSISWA